VFCGQYDTLGVFHADRRREAWIPDLFGPALIFGLLFAGRIVAKVCDAGDSVLLMEHRVNCLCRNTTPQSDRA
jgi:hypothetical protein